MTVYSPKILMLKTLCAKHFCVACMHRLFIQIRPIKWDLTIFILAFPVCAIMLVARSREWKMKNRDATRARKSLSEKVPKVHFRFRPKDFYHRNNTAVML